MEALNIRVRASFNVTKSNQTVLQYKMHNNYSHCSKPKSVVCIFKTTCLNNSLKEIDKQKI